MTFFWTNLNFCSHGRCVCETDSLFVKKISQVQKIQPLVLVKYLLCRPCQVFISMEIIPPPPPQTKLRGGGIFLSPCALSVRLPVPRLLTRLSTHAVGNRCIDCSESLWTHYSISEDVHLEFFYPLDNHSLFYKIFSFFIFYFFITRNPVLKIMKIFYLNIEKCVAVVVGDVVELKLYIYFYDLQ